VAPRFCRKAAKAASPQGCECPVDTLREAQKHPALHPNKHHPHPKNRRAAAVLDGVQGAKLPAGGVGASSPRKAPGINIYIPGAQPGLQGGNAPLPGGVGASSPRKHPGNGITKKQRR
jgi:hypothetical protein